MSLTSRISLKGIESTDSPEDVFSASLGVIFPDDVTNQHGDDENSLVYTSPHLPKPLYIELANPTGETDRELFSHYLWNSSLLLAELIEADTLGLAKDARDAKAQSFSKRVSFNVRGLKTLELGAGTALPSIMGGLLGAARVGVTDYPSDVVLKTLRENVSRNIDSKLAPEPEHLTTSVVVEGHSWGIVDDAFGVENEGAFDRVIASDCLWMPWQHDNLRKSIAYFLSREASARAWVVAGFHTGRDKMSAFFDAGKLSEAGLEIEALWERDCDGVERSWAWRREDDSTYRKRWLAMAVLRRVQEKKSS